jgi:TATA-binding protein-associated factor Taf7
MGWERLGRPGLGLWHEFLNKERALKHDYISPAIQAWKWKIQSGAESRTARSLNLVKHKHRHKYMQGQGQNQEQNQEQEQEHKQEHKQEQNQEQERNQERNREQEREEDENENEDEHRDVSILEAHLLEDDTELFAPPHTYHSAGL